MSDYDYFEGDDLDSAFLNEVDAIESSYKAKNHINGNQQYIQPQVPAPNLPSRPRALAPAESSDDYDMSFNVDASELDRLDKFISESYAGRAQPFAGPSKQTRQTTLDGRTLPQSTPKSSLGNTLSRTVSHRNSLGSKDKAQKTKTWDHTAFAETGFLKTKGRRKGKGKQVDCDEEEEGDEPVEFEQFPAPFVPGESPSLVFVFAIMVLSCLSRTFKILSYAHKSCSPPPPMKLKPDLLAAKTWLYPLNRARRDYQFNIAKNSLFQNTLVALPTGLGKTFIAGVVMLNYYKWFPEGRIIFVAPTKPLVAQQIEACHQLCGIPGRDAAELTGNVQKTKRMMAWTEKRVLYMTPQTLRNDLISGLADPMDIILLVIDEAHKGTGDYAYAQVVRYMMAKNPHFRVLALTATPGNTPEAVQSIVDSLHISHIEIRNEQSQDLRRYIHEKEVQTHVIKMTDHVKAIRDSLSKVIDPMLKKVRQAGLVHTQNPVMLHPYACQAALGQMNSRRDAKALMWAFGILKVLGHLARSMGYLMECSSRMCFDNLKSMQEKLSQSKSASDKRLWNGLMGDQNFKALMSECERQRTVGFAPHPKMDQLLYLVLSHLTEAEEQSRNLNAENNNRESIDTKIMVFVQFRDCLDEIIDIFAAHRPIIRPMHFIGQGVDKQGRKGFAQSKQLEVIQKFKKGEYNVLVSTSIGEEGLDIGEIDRIICYDAQKSSIRMLQRVGRTGRQRKGNVDVLLAEEREERNWEKSKENYTDVQESIISGNQLILYEDVKRLLPENAKPQCLQMEMEIEEYVRSPVTSPRPPPPKEKKRKRNDDIARNVPLGATMGFVSASKLRPRKESKAKKLKLLKPLDDSDVESDSDDAEIAAGLNGTTAAVSKNKRKDPAKKDVKSKNPRKAKDQRSIGSYFDTVPNRLEDDEDDMDIKNGLSPLMRRTSTPKAGFSSQSESDFDMSPVRTAQRQIRSSTPGKQPHLSIDTYKSSDEKRTLFIRSPPPISSRICATEKEKKNMDWLLENASDSDVEVAPPSNDGKDANSYSQSARTHLHTTGSSLEKASQELVVDVGDSSSIPDMTQPVQRPMKRLGSRMRIVVSSPLEGDSPPRRLIRRKSTSPSALTPNSSPSAVHVQPNPRRRPKKQKLNMKNNPLLFDVEAEHSGEEVSAGESDVDMAESDSDRLFLEEPSETQVSPSYNQTAMYRMGLMTQAPGGPQFANKPKRTGAFAGGRTQVRRPVIYSSPPPEPDEYEMGSFVVQDDESLLYNNSSEP